LISVLLYGQIRAADVSNQDVHEWFVVHEGGENVSRLVESTPFDGGGITCVGWLQDWSAYVNCEGQRPGPIANGQLVTAEGTPKQHLVADKDYRLVNRGVWNLFLKL
jgi:hypothetical protein